MALLSIIVLLCFGCCSVVWSCLTVCDPTDCSTPGLPVPHHRPKLAQVHVCCIGDAPQASHPLMSYPPTLNLSQHQGFFQWITWDDQNIGVSTSSSILSRSIQGWFPLWLTSLISVLSKGLSGVFSRTTVRRHQFFSAPPSLWSTSHNHIITRGKTIALTIHLYWLYCLPLSKGKSGFFSFHKGWESILEIDMKVEIL